MMLARWESSFSRDNFITTYCRWLMFDLNFFHPKKPNVILCFFLSISSSKAIGYSLRCFAIFTLEWMWSAVRHLYVILWQSASTGKIIFLSFYTPIVFKIEERILPQEPSPN